MLDLYLRDSGTENIILMGSIAIRMSNLMIYLIRSTTDDVQGEKTGGI